MSARGRLRCPRCRAVIGALVVAFVAGLSVGVLVGVWAEARAGFGQTCMEDDPCWDCSEMGNRVCGPDVRGTGFAPKAPVRPVVALAGSRVAPVAPDHSWVVSGPSDGWPGRKCIHIRTMYLFCAEPVEGGKQAWR